ncbi:MAG: cobalamin-independent methionine synthase II family protein [Desulfurococcales archaeon]|jgi:5-methyltetrahydropteroyltriglutamate--homocysteine methyltransferase|nr:cobalamin-independent methionine synthase II family protein [Desulfurococcales archaeon]
MQASGLFPVTVVGSWPRPKWILEALRKKREGSISQEEFDAIADEAVLLAIKYQEDAGVDILSDGEQRRDNFYSFISDKVRGIALKTVAEIVDLVPDKSRFESLLRSLDVPAYSIRNPVVVSRLSVGPRGIARDEASFLRDHTSRLIKIPLPGPYLLTRSSWVPGISDKHYLSREELGFEYAKLLREEIIALRDLGVFFVQLDEPVLSEVVYGSDQSQQTFMCAALFSRRNPKEELEFAVELINEAVRGVSGIKTGIHICRGNWSRREEALLKGDYVPLMPYLAETRVDQLVLEFATPRAGDVEALRDYIGDKELGYGVVNPRTDDVESPQEIIARVNKILRFMDAKKIYLNPDCGFGTFAEAPVNTPRTAFRKLRSMRIAADELRKLYGER